MREAAEHFWPWYSNEPRRMAVATAAGIGRRVREDEVLAPGLAHQPRVAPVAVDVLADGTPHALEHRRRAREVDPGQIGVGEHRIADLAAGAEHHVDHARREPGRLVAAA